MKELNSAVVENVATVKTQRPKMKQWKICTGQCGPMTLYSNVIKAYTKEEAVQKLLEKIKGKGNEFAPEWYLEHCYEHIPTPRKKAE